MLYKEEKTGLFFFYETRTTFNDSRFSKEGSRETFTHLPEDMNFVLEKPSTINIEQSVFIPTPEQQERLVFLNNVIVPQTTKMITFHAAINFVRYGLIVPNSSIDDLIEDNERREISLLHLKNVLAEEIRRIRKEREESGTSVLFNGTEVPIRTDLASQAKVAAVKQLLEDPEHSEITSVDWELQPFIWDTIDLEKIKVVSIAVFNHVQECFTKARQQQQAIFSCSSPQELLNLSLEWIEDITMFDSFSSFQNL